jgi:hypothetical protein
MTYGASCEMPDAPPLRNNLAPTDASIPVIDTGAANPPASIRMADSAFDRRLSEHRVRRLLAHMTSRGQKLENGLKYFPATRSREPCPDSGGQNQRLGTLSDRILPLEGACYAACAY